MKSILFFSISDLPPLIPESDQNEVSEEQETTATLPGSSGENNIDRCKPCF